MNRDEEILEKLNALSISQRKILKEQLELKRTQLEMEMRIHAGMEAVQMTLLSRQDELKGAIDAFVSGDHAVPGDNEVWLDKTRVMELLFMTNSTFYRRRQEENWQRKRIGKRVYYLKSSIV